MTIEELEKQFLELKESNEKVTAQLNAVTKENATLKDDNKRLLNYNNELFMKVTTPTVENKKENKDDYPVIESASEFEKKQIEDLRELMKERRN